MISKRCCSLWLFQFLANTQSASWQLFCQVLSAFIIQRMNKQNSLPFTNEGSTEAHESSGKYFSRYKQQQRLKNSQQSSQHQTSILPYRYEKAALVIQRFYRGRLLMRRKYLEAVRDELKIGNEIMKFQNEALYKLIDIYSKDCQEAQNRLRKKAKAFSAREEDILSLARKACVGLTFKMQKQTPSEHKIEGLANELAHKRQYQRQLLDRRASIQAQLQGPLHQQEGRCLRSIKEQNMLLLKITREKQELERSLKEEHILRSKFAIKPDD